MRIVILVLLSLLVSCNEQDIRKQTPAIGIDSMVALIRPGDLILRAGRDEVSQLFKRLNTRNQTYSHCGMAVADDSGIAVIHLISTAKNPSGAIIKEPLKLFVQPKSNSGWAIVRYDVDNRAKQNLIKVIEVFYRKSISFDHDFDLATDDKMYCTEMIYKAFILATKDSLLILPTLTQTGKKYIAVDNLFGHKHCKTIGEITYK
jgi:hypothetical protein